MSEDKEDELEQRVDALEQRSEKIEKDLLGELSYVPKPNELPEVPQINVKLPEIPKEPELGGFAPAHYRSVGIALNVATSFIAPILVLGVGGMLLDKQVGNTTSWFALAGTLIGLIAGVMGLLRAIQTLNK